MHLWVDNGKFQLCFSFLGKADVVELGGSDELSGKGSDLSLFLFTDMLEVSKVFAICLSPLQPTLYS